MRSSKILSHADAMVIIDAIRREADAGDRGLAVAVVDTHGELIAFLRTDGCALPPITIAQNKAYAAARERKETFELGKQSREQGFPMTNFGELRYPSWGGGVPVIIDGEVIGAVGVSGLPEADDIVFAKAGIAAFLATQK
jgi:glc operon protein GlcG